MKPTFIGIGAQKCASTWLYDILADHPQVCLSTNKEIDFFSYYFDYGFQWYERHFECGEVRPAVGEISPSYFHGAGVPKRVYDYNPDLRLILFLRDPIARAFSNHLHEVRIGHLQGNDITFEYGLANNPSYIDQGLYATHLEHWLEYFPRDRILVVLFDDVISSKESVAKTVYKFLGISDSHKSESLFERSNESYVNRFALLERAKNGIRLMVKNAGLGWAWDAVGRLGPQRLYRALNRRPFEAIIPPIDESTKQALRIKFGDEVHRLESLINRSLDHWL